MPAHSIREQREASPTCSTTTRASVPRTPMTGSAWADIAPGYLSPSGYRLLADAFAHLRDLRLLYEHSPIADAQAPRSH